MSKQIYFACSYQNRNEYTSLIEALKQAVVSQGFELVVPVFDLAHLNPKDYASVMSESFLRLKQASLLIAEASEKNIGIGIEVGFAKALKIPIVYLYRETAELSTTVAGTADYEISYEEISEVIQKINAILEARMGVEPI